MNVPSRSEIQDYLISKLEELLGKHQDIKPASTLYHDLSLSGDDAYELLEALKNRFGTSFATFKFDQYFPNETEAMWYHIGKKIGLRDRKRIEISVDHLVKVIEQGSWFSPS